MKNKKDLYIITVFFIIVFSVFLYYPIKYVLLSKNILTLNYDNFKEFNADSGNDIFTKINNKVQKVKLNIENRVINYFPFYSAINYNFKSLNYKINKGLYNHLDFTYIGLNQDNELVYRENNGTYILQFNIDNKILENKFNSQSEYFNELKKYADVYIYLPNRYEYTNLSKKGISVQDNSKYVERLFSMQDEKLHVAALNSETLEQYNSYFYKTDHHWTAYGAYEGYKEIMNLLGHEPLILNLVSHNVNFMGSISKGVALTDIKDNFSTIDYINNIDVTVNGETNNPKYKPKQIKESNNPYYDYYVSYYNGMFGRVEYNSHNSALENILIISDSFGWPIDEIIAKDFNKTYIFNVKYDEFVNNAIDYKKFVKENNISKVLIIQSSESTLFDLYNFNLKEKVR